MNTNQIYLVAVLSFAVSAISVTVTTSSLFATFRGWLLERNEWFGKLFSCSYCFGHWMLFLAMIFYGPNLLPDRSVLLSFPATYFAMVALSAVVSGAIITLLPFKAKERSDQQTSQVARRNEFQIPLPPKERVH